MHAELCPVCQGTGKVPGPHPQPKPNEPVPTAHDSSVQQVDCYGCGGLGWIQVGDESPE